VTLGLLFGRNWKGGVSEDTVLRGDMNQDLLTDHYATDGLLHLSELRSSGR
jgi:hypothetical protein